MDVKGLLNKPLQKAFKNPSKTCQEGVEIDESACVSECVLKTLAASVSGLRVSPSKSQVKDN